jgi:tetratricopeptide (TPR) repeat protein
MRWLLVAVLLLPGTLLAGLDEDFNEAVELYDQGRFDASVEAFRDIIERGYVSAELYYNLGCAYFKAGELGRAIANFRRAERLAPDDEDIQINAEFARLFMVDKIEGGPTPFFPDQVVGWLSQIHPNQYYWFSLISFSLVFLFLTLRRLGILFRYANTIAVVLLAVSLIAAGSMVWVLKTNYLVEEGVIVVSETEVLSGPGSEFELQFNAHEGLTFRILDSRNDYYLGLFANQLKGWVKTADVVRI